MIMSEDITYCISECNDMECFRNKRHIKLLIPHSFAFLKGTEDCHKMQKKLKMKVINGGVKMIEIVSDSKQTNADRIRGLNDEELTKFIEAIICSSCFTDEECGFLTCQSMNGNYCHGIKDREPDKRILEWLQQPEE